MAKLHISLLLLHLLSVFLAMSSSEPTFGSRAFIEASCRATRYPSLCVACISSYANATNATLTSPQELSQVSLSVSLVKARFTQAYIRQVSQSMIKGNKQVKQGGKDHQTMQDCLTQINDSVYRLSQSIRELRQMFRNEGDDFMWHTSNVDAWVSAALTDASMCLDEFSWPAAISGKMKATIKAKVLNVAQVTSNALALFHRYTRWHRVAGSTKKP